MFIPVPIGVDGHQGRVPRVTIALLVINLLVFFLTHRGAPIWTEEELARFEKMAAWELQKAGQSNSDLTTRVEAAPSAVAFLIEDKRWEHDVTDMESRALLGRIVDDYRTRAADSIPYRFGLRPGALRAPSLISHMFLHVDGVHLLFNMLFLWIAGSVLEITWGPKLYACLYLALGVAAGVAHTAMHSGSLVPAVGASGAVAGLMGAFLIHHAKTPMRMALIYGGSLPTNVKLTTVPAWVFLASWIGEQLYRAMASHGIDVEVSFAAHIGGFIAGIVAALIVRQRVGSSSPRPGRRKLVGSTTTPTHP